MGTREYTLVPNLVKEIILLNIYATSCEIFEMIQIALSFT